MTTWSMNPAVSVSSYNEVTDVCVRACVRASHTRRLLSAFNDFHIDHERTEQLYLKHCKC